MNNDENQNQYTQYSQNPYQQQGPDQAFLAGQPIEPQQPENISAVRKITRFLVRTKVISTFQNRPMLATLTLFAIGAGLAAGITSGISTDETAATPVENLPVISAQTTSFKKAPSDDETRNATSATDESTIFTVMRDDAFEAGGEKKVRNLLAPETVEKPITDKLASFEEKAEALLAETKKATPGETTAKVAEILNTSEPAAGDVSIPSRKPQVIASTEAPKDIIRKAEPEAEAKKPESLHAAGASPDTLAFVRSVLDNKDKKKPVSDVSARLLNTVEPAAGSADAKSEATTTKTIANITNGGAFYVQLGSVTSPDGAEKAWDKYAAEFGLQGSSHRVQEANLGARGTFYRIQAGPFEETQAYDLCKSIKAKKPGGCLVVN